VPSPTFATTLLAFVPVDNFQLIAGEDALSPYGFNKHVILHNFCKTCGIKSFARGKKPDGTAMVAINARCLDDPPPFTARPFDGANWEQAIDTIR